MDNPDNKPVYFRKTIYGTRKTWKYCLGQEEGQYSSSSSGSLRIPNIFPTDLTLLITC